MVDQIQMPPSAYSVAPSGRVKRAKRDKRDRRQRRFPREGDNDQDDRDMSASEREEAPASEQKQGRQKGPQAAVRPGLKTLKANRKKRRGKRIDIRI